MDYSETETPYIRRDSRSLTQDVMQSILWHGGIIGMIGAYLLLAELLAMLYQPTYENQDARSVIGVEFIAPDSNSTSSPEVAKQEKIAALQSPKSQPSTPEKPIVINEPKQEEAQQKIQPVKAAFQQEKSLPTQVQRQASRMASTTRTSTAKKINIRRSVGAQSSTQTIGSVRAESKKQSNTHGTLRQANAQVLAAKNTKSSAPKIVKNSSVKKTTESLTKIATTPKTMDRSRSRATSAVKKTPERTQSQIRQDAEKQRQVAARRAQQLADDKRRAAIAAEQKKQREHMIVQTIQRYGQMITEKIQHVALFNPGMNGLKSQLKIQLKPDGHVQSVALRASSGNASFDRLAINAVYKAAPLPLPDDQEISQLMMQINLTIQPDIHSPSSE
jgi:colicin import membrane protein